MLKLVIEDDEGKQTTIPIVRDEITIGRLDGNTIRLTERNVSRRHARLLKTNGHLFFENTQARYGSMRNGEKVMGRVEFNQGDVFLVGDYRLYLEPPEGHAPPPGTAAAAAQIESEQRDATEVLDVPKATAAAAASVGHALVAPTGGPPVAVSQHPKLVILNTGYAGSEFFINQPELVIGRTDENDIVIDHRSISRHHAKITQSEGVIRITDLGSANGVRVNGEPYTTIELRRGDVVEMGHVKVRYVAPGEPFTFQPTDEDREEAGGGSAKLLLILAVVVVLLGGGIALAVMSGGGGGDGDGGGGSEGGGGEETTPSGVTPTGTETGASQTTSAVDSEALLLQADRLINQGEWDQARETLASIEVGDALYDQAEERRIKIRSETRYQGIYQNVLDAEQQQNFAQALELLAEIPEDSYYYQLAQREEVKRRLEDTFKRTQLQAAQASVEANDFDAARRALAEVEPIFPDDTDIQNANAAIDQAEEAYQREQARLEEQRREAERREREAARREDQERQDEERQDEQPEARRDDREEQQPEEPEEPEEPEVDVEQLIRDAQRAGLRGNHSEAIRLLEQARDERSGDRRIPLMLYQNYAAIGNNRSACRNLERYLRLDPESPFRDTYDELCSD